MADLLELLTRLSLEHWAPVLAEEELSVALLRSMGASLHSNLLELDDSNPDEARRLAEAILQGGEDVHSLSHHKRIVQSEPEANRAAILAVSSVAAADLSPLVLHQSESACSAHANRVASLQDEFYAEDLFLPEGSESWTDKELREFFASGGIIRPVASGASVAGKLTIKWQAKAMTYPYDSSSTVLDLRLWLEAQTGVPAAWQKLVGLGSPGRPPPLEERIIALRSNDGKRAVLLVGSRPAEVEAATQELERGRRASVEIRNDLNDPGYVNRRSALDGSCSRRPGRALDSQRPIEAQRGAGIYLDPAVWAPEVNENSRGPAYAGTQEENYVRNPRTGRLEQLSLANALLGNDAVAAGRRVEVPLRPEQAPPNVDLTGQVRGQCTSCIRCTGYERLERYADNENDVEILRCARCGCQSHQHEAL
mmetsp:Transcript_2235/g.7095  ORF Transcript_2235/g.7095 Transcript_2235/m.7095 type:complete len:424 (-) Transcript_2235:752-2023(-)